jgi:hypothetical protein
MNFITISIKTQKYFKIRETLRNRNYYYFFFKFTPTNGSLWKYINLFVFKLNAVKCISRKRIPTQFVEHPLEHDLNWII